MPSISLPKGGGAIRGIGEKFSTDVAMGTGSLSVPIATSPGRSGFELGLELAYDSGSGNGPFGIGWHLSTPSVSRKTDKGLPRYADAEDSDVFILSGAEDLVPVRVRDGAGTHLDAFDRGDYRVQRYRPRTEGLFARIERWTNRTTGDTHWRAITRDNVLNVYGRSRSARVADPDQPERVFSWLLEETRDDRGNVASYTYKAEDSAGIDPGKTCESNRFERQGDGSARFLATAQRYLKRIQYGNRTPVMDREAPPPASEDDWLFEVLFDYGEHDEAHPTTFEVRPWLVRRDPFSSFRSTFEVRSYRLCRRVLMFHRFVELGPTPCLVRSTDFTYDEGNVVTYLTAVSQAGYKREGGAGAYERATLPPLDLGYTRAKVHDELRVMDRASLEGIPGGLDEARAVWVDLDGEGIPGVLIPSERAWYYKANLGGGALAPPSLERTLPAPAELLGGTQQLSDLGGDGNLDLVSYAPPLAGYFERTPEGRWAPFVALPKLPNIDWSDPNLRFLDVDGDGFPDIFLSEHDAFVWYRSRAKRGFEPAESRAKPGNELEGAAVVFADGTETIQLADMSGDGLVDIVRVRNGEVCYWPNLGNGRFGRRITLEESPTFDAPDQFDPKRVRFADIDGSGTSDIVYLGRDRVRIYFNESGNGLTRATAIETIPPIDSLSSLSIVDLLGQGTACLVWSSPLPGDHARPLAYVDLMGGKKPHVLERIVNNLGAETRIAYAPSTKFYLEDKARGKPWLTRLAFPVHVLERVERYDHVTKSLLVTRFAYHHGYFDGNEREFRGFACVEQWDAESFSAERGKGLFADVPDDVNPDDRHLILPPVRTVSWFHTGAWLDRERLELALAREYYDGDPEAPLLPDTTLPEGLSTEEEREAARALRGQVLRQEIYAEDGTPEAIHPYTVSERDHEVRLLQHAEERTRAVFFVHPRHTISLHYERRPNDPRIQHELVLQVDEFGQITESAALGYPRRVPAEPEQARLWATLTSHTFAHRTNESDWYRVGVPVETTTRELIGLGEPARRVFDFEELAARAASATEVPYEASGDDAGSSATRRIIERERQVYYRDDLSGPLPLGQVESRALAYESYRQVFTPGLLTATYANRVLDPLLESEGRYVREDGVWWVPSGRVLFDPARFYLPVEKLDPFGQRHTVRYDGYALLVLEVEDPLQQRVTAGTRNAAGDITLNGNDYRALGPVLLTDPNRNRTAVVLDALGAVVKAALMGKEGEAEGDTLADPTTRIEYDLHRFRTTNGRLPVTVHTFSREQHGVANPRWQQTYSYSDGAGREIMRKVQAEPGLVPILVDGHLLRNAGDGALQMRRVSERWLGTGRTVFDNKGNAIKKYEPFFSDTFEYEDERELVEWGVTPILRHDPLGRLVRTDRPNGTHARVVFDAWRLETWDENDTVAGTPWLLRKQAGTPSEQRCARLALAHAGTPSVAHLDSLGRVFLTIADNGPAGLRPTRVELDVEGNQRSVIDARGNMILRQFFDMLGRTLRVVRADTGPRDASHRLRAVPVETDPDGERTLLDVTNKPIRVWDERGHTLRRSYDELERPTHLFVRQGAAPEKLVERTVYGEAHRDAEARNLRTRAYQVYDGAGVLTNSSFDFKGNLLESTRRLASDYRESPDWAPIARLTAASGVESAAEPLLDSDAGSFTISATYDALNRVTSRTTPDRSVTRHTYNEANLLERIEVQLRAATDPADPSTPLWTTFLSGIDYNARGQRERVELGNGTVSTYDYEEETFRLVRQRTVRTRDNARLQDLRYEHDPVGNIVEIPDAVSFGNTNVSASCFYEYDALYQLVLAEGREHPGPQPSADDPELLRLDHPNDLQALRRYRESYAYDPAGNIERMAHQPLEAGASGWTRRYSYALDCNRLLRTSVPGDAPGTLSARYEHDEAGNMVRMPHLPEMRWDYANRLVGVTKQIQNGDGPGNEVYFAYDAAGERVRKVYEHSGLVEERIYLGGYEVYRKRAAGGRRVEFERQTLSVMDKERRVVLIETNTLDESSAAFSISAFHRFQLEDRVGSVVMALDGRADPIAYDEYHPFGSTSFHMAAAQVNATRQGFTGRERDAETGLSYHGKRYYALWLGRWSARDPENLIDGPNMYAYATNNPIFFSDTGGTNANPRRQAEISRQTVAAIGRLVAGEPGDPPRGTREAEIAQHTEAAQQPQPQTAGAGASGTGSGSAPPVTSVGSHSHSPASSTTSSPHVASVGITRQVRRHQERRRASDRTVAQPHEPSQQQSSRGPERPWYEDFLNAARLLVIYELMRRGGGGGGGGGSGGERIRVGDLEPTPQERVRVSGPDRPTSEGPDDEREQQIENEQTRRRQQIVIADPGGGGVLVFDAQRGVPQDHAALRGFRSAPSLNDVVTTVGMFGLAIAGIGALSVGALVAAPAAIASLPALLPAAAAPELVGAAAALGGALMYMRNANQHRSRR